jgi:hypothetical protein
VKVVDRGQITEGPGDVGDPDGVHADEQPVYVISGPCPARSGSHGRLAYGPSEFAFTFQKTFQPDDEFQRGIDWASFVPCPAAS